MPTRPIIDNPPTPTIVERLRRKRFLCRLGFHRMVQTERLITTGRARCGEEWITSLFGSFPVPKVNGHD